MPNRITNVFRAAGSLLNPSSIDSLKSMVSRRGGITSPNRFGIILSPPSRALLNLDVRDIGVRIASGTFNIGSLVNDPRDIAMLCDSVTLPGRQITSEDRPLALFAEKKATGTLIDSIQCNFLSTNDFYIKKMFDSWQNMIVNRSTRTLAYEDDYKVPMTIMQLNSANIPVFSVRLSGVFPITVNSIELDNAAEMGSTKIAVTLSFDDYEPAKIDDVLRTQNPFPALINRF